MQDPNAGKVRTTEMAEYDDYGLWPSKVFNISKSVSFPVKQQ